ncbi:UDP-glucuronosyltransferase 2B10 [Drosophila sechellia]|uniref:UDP-glucuronosyltransferase n=1 Tax=Drosophila sechellia TaxID=7238 RepID=B4HIF1_DROSE|nr:UDP-glucuronosyltransferase 2B10 [Drosophila sechellia]EDW42666.1 GM26133 [Drosophila sechellia]
MRLLPVIAIVFCALSAKPLQTESAKILATLPFPGRSQYIFLESYLKALAAKGHQVTVINAFKNKETPNMRFIEALKAHDFAEEMMTLLNVPLLWQQLNAIDYILNKFIDTTMEDEGVQKLLNSGETFDLVLAEMLQMEPLYALAQHFNATLVGFSSFGTDRTIDEAAGNISPISYNPLVTSPRTDRMTFLERLENHYDVIVEDIHRHFIHLPHMRKVFKKYFPNAKKTMEEVMDSFSLILLGQHFSLSYPRPYLPNMIEVGGMQISHKPKPLPEDIKQFIEGSPHGVIYFSMGSNVKSKDLPQETRDTLLKAFAKLKQRVLWKFEDDEMPGKPANVLIKKWYPQPDILAHPNVKLFISHGGLLSSTESVYFGKPILGLPCFYDQHMNVQRAQRVGFGLGLDLNNMKQEDLEKAIQTLLTDPSYAKAALTISERYRDQPESAVDRAVWWTEYVIRHNGAPHLRAASRDLNFIQLHSLDTFAVILAVPLLVTLLILKLSCKLLRGKKQKCPHSDKLKKH